ncbi:MAG TPA: hypothetical protein VFC92_01860 [Bacteroidales bacterium]|nr:hypothetical protein [Bacteroidales bacterium]
MKKQLTHFARLLLTLILLVGNVSPASATLVTFRVDMAEVDVVSPLGVHIAGNFQGWDPAATMMVKPPIGKIYTLKLDLPAGETILWKYINGTTWADVEDLNSAYTCVIGNDHNRVFEVPAEDVTIPTVCFESCISCNPLQVDMTFQVDMSNQTVSPLGVHVAGSFQGWNTGATEMLPVGNGVYAVTVSVGVGEYHEYKFLNGNAWVGGETVPPQCAHSNNRWVIVPAVTTTLDPVCFGSCYPCGPPPVDVEITFQVDMSMQQIAPAGVHIGGGFQGWQPGDTPMTSIGEGVYTYTTILPSGTYQEYKFINGTTWEEAENLPEECSLNNNRYFTVPEANSVFPVVCYGMCGPCPEPVLVEITFRVDMSEEILLSEGVHLLGSFNDFDPAATPMTDAGAGIYTATIVLEEFEQIQFKYVNGNTLAGAETVPAACSDPSGYRTLTVPGNDLTLPVVCFGSCEPCVPPPAVNVTFQVEMSNDTVSAEGIHLTGSFQNWDPASTMMSPIGDNIYAVTLILESGTHHTFKYINGITFDEQEQVPPACGEDDNYGGYNRYLDVPLTDLVLAPVCFGACTPCVVPADIEVTFSVDMSNEEVSPLGVHLAGAFNGWNTDTAMMLPMGEGIYEFTTQLVAGEYYEYKFLNGNTTDDYEQVPEACSFEGNRYLTVASENMILDLVCFGTCTTCIPPLPVEITFSVDMSNEIVSVDGVFLAGSFNDFNATATPMLAGGFGIYSVTLTLQAGTHQTFKYLNGPSFDFEEAVPEACGEYDNFVGYNRFVDVPAENLSLPVVCFGSCEACLRSQIIELTAGWNSLSSFRQPDQENLDTLMEQIANELIILQDLTGSYVSSSGPNTLTTWNSSTGYSIKVNEAVSLNITGVKVQDKSLELEEGWNLIPVLSSEPVAVDSLFDAAAESLIIVKEMAGTGVFWPAFDINTLQNLMPGKAYLVKMNAPATITFP